MKQPKISFRVRGGSGPLAIYWHDGPYGDATESQNGIGVGWFSPDGTLLGVEFDDVSRDADLQELKFKNVSVSAAVHGGKIDVKKKVMTRKVKKAHKKAG